MTRWGDVVLVGQAFLPVWLATKSMKIRKAIIQFSFSIFHFAISQNRHHVRVNPAMENEK